MIEQRFLLEMDNVLVSGFIDWQAWSTSSWILSTYSCKPSDHLPDGQDAHLTRM